MSRSAMFSEQGRCCNANNVAKGLRGRGRYSVVRGGIKGGCDIKISFDSYIYIYIYTVLKQIS